MMNDEGGFREVRKEQGAGGMEHGAQRTAHSVNLFHCENGLLKIEALLLKLE
jgi:hypothetical protein